MADEDYTVLTPIDREALRDVMTLGSIEKVAKKQHKSDANIRLKVNKAIDKLERQIKIWQDSQEKMMEMNIRVQKLENVVEHRGQVILTQNERINQQKDEIIRLKTLLRGQTSTNLKPEEKEGRVRVNDTMRWKLGGRLEIEKIPQNLVEKLNRHSIYTIYDLVRYRENQLSRLEGITLSDLAKIIACLKRINLHLDTDVLWIEEYKDYYINKKQRT